ncbi:MAG: NAD-dependent epimerase/dehydratase family protein [Candidatus Marinimicrobia bacterium]|jgi:UDP-glucuronate 4-epimerase|nr:NAD-dependent epimerase/dehydratase family protein [Candidatus Neomarinimicrobiota bacterium]
MSKKLLVTGSAGFIGFHLSKSLLEDGFEVMGVDNLNDYYDPSLKQARLNQLEPYENFSFNKVDISNRDSITKIFQNFKPNIVINLAAQAGVRYSLENPYAYMDSNLVGFLNIIELCRHNDVKGLVYASSSSVYGGNEKSPSSVKDKTDKPLSLYGATKKSNELIAHSYSHLYDLHTTGLRYFTVYGPWGRPDMAMFIFAKKILEDKPITVFNNGNMKRDFTFIDDIIDGTRAAINKNYKFEVFNLGNHKSENLMDMIAFIEIALNKKAKINFEPMHPGDVKESFAEIEKSRNLLDFVPKTNISDGVNKFIKWYKDYYHSK